MPPVARTIGLMLVLASPVCLAAQTPPGESYFSRAAHDSHAGRPWVSQAHRELPAATTSQPGRVVPADFQSPLPSFGDLPESGRQERSPNQAGSPPQANTPGTMPLAPPGGDPPIPLTPHGRSNRTGQGSRAGRPGGLPSLVTVTSSLAVVLGLFLVVAWLMHHTAPSGSALLPSEVVEVLGRAALASRQQVHLLRCGNKLLLVSVSPTGVETLTEITEPDEVDRLAGLCRQAHPVSATAAFRQVFSKQFVGQHSRPGFPDGSEGVRPADARIPSTAAGTPRTKGRTLEDRDV